MSVIGIIGEFYKDSGNRLKLNSLTVITETLKAYDGKVHRGRDGYDVEWSRHYGYMFHNSSGGGAKTVEVSGIYFMSGDVTVEEFPCQFVDHRDRSPFNGKRTKAVRKRNRTRRLPVLPKAFDMDGCANLLEWLEQHAIQSDAVYCSVCRDYYPTSDEWNMCEHIWWCEKTGWWSTPSERCKCKTRELCQGEE
jgi:hypothetical protein